MELTSTVSSAIQTPTAGAESNPSWYNLNWSTPETKRAAIGVNTIRLALLHNWPLLTFAVVVLIAATGWSTPLHSNTSNKKAIHLTASTQQPDQNAGSGTTNTHSSSTDPIEGSYNDDYSYGSDKKLAGTSVILDESCLEIRPTAVSPSSCPVIDPGPIDPEPLVRVASTAQDDILSAINEIRQAKGGTLYFPAGKYTISHDSAEPIIQTHLTFGNVGQLRIIGDGPDLTTLEMERNEVFQNQQTRLIKINNADQIEIADLALRGQRKFVTPGTAPSVGEVFWSSNGATEAESRKQNQAEHQSLIFLRGIHGSTYIHDIKFRHAGGDGINLAEMTNVVIAYNDLDDLGRNGFTLGGKNGLNRNKNILILGNSFGSNIDTQVVDLELHGSGFHNFEPNLMNDNIKILYNRFEKLVPVDLIDQDQYAISVASALNTEIRGNDLGGNPITSINDQKTVYINNTGIGGARIHRRNSIKMINNTFDLKPLTRRNWLSKVNGGLLFMETAGELPVDIVFEGNTVNSAGVIWPLYFHNIPTISLRNNIFNTESSSRTIRIEADRTNTDIYLSGNKNLDTEDLSIEESAGWLVHTLEN